MKDAIAAASGITHRLDEFARAIRNVRGWERATAEQVGEHSVRVSNPAAGLWIECRHREGATLGSMTIGRLGETPFFQPEFVRPNADFVTFRAKQFVQGARAWDRRARARRLDPRLWLLHRRVSSDIARQRRERTALASAS
ncbi:hypothetical protein ACGFZA_09585 [Streptomyces sp. NPDC048211]|uniref:hypothetical protein n=1 Tax=Streptomyces sp. NPDC048211 TaxID=3365516 RepID=UPI00371DD06D